MIKINTKFTYFKLSKILQFLLLIFNFIDSNKFTFLSIFVIISSFYILLANSLATGSNWVLNGAIGLADNLFTIGYSQGISDQYSTSTPYFPFVAFIAYLVKFFSTQYQVEILLIIAAFLIYGLYSVLFFYYRKLKGEQGFLVFLALFVSISFFFFNTYLIYARNFKADTISLLFFFLAFLLILQEKRNYWRISAIIFFIFLATISKQQIIAPIIGLTIIILLKKTLPIKFKIIDISLISIGIILALIIISLIKGSLNYTIFSFGGHKFFIDKIHNNKQILILLSFFLFYGFLFHKDFFKSLAKNSVLLIPSILWLISGVSGSFKVGGDPGNSEVGLLLLIPVFIKALDRSKKFVILILCFSFLTNIDIISKYNFAEIYHKRILLENRLIDNIVKLNPQSIIITTNGYIIAQKAKIKKIHDILTWGHLKMNASNLSISKDGNQVLAELHPDVIFCIDRCKFLDNDWKFNPLLFGYKEIKIQEYRNDILFVAKNKINQTF